MDDERATACRYDLMPHSLLEKEWNEWRARQGALEGDLL